MTTIAEDTRHEEARIRFEDNIRTGLTFHYAEQSNASADRMSYHPMVRPENYGQVVVALGKIAQMGPLFAFAADKALRKVSPFFTGNQIMAGIAQAFGDIVRNGWEDVAAATGPEAGRPSDHKHEVNERQAIFLNLAYSEIAFSLNDLGCTPGVGWVLAGMVSAQKINIFAHHLPNVAKRLAA